MRRRQFITFVGSTAVLWTHTGKKKEDPALRLLKIFYLQNSRWRFAALLPR
jgi:hypothetical protein